MKAYQKRKKIFFLKQGINSKFWMKKSTVLFKILLFINLFFIVIQQLLFESSSLGIELPLVILFTPILCFINLFFFLFWFFRFKWPALISILFFLINLNSLQLIYQIKPNAISTSRGLNIMSFNINKSFILVLIIFTVMFF